jgi:hypothetical protein
VHLRCGSRRDDGAAPGREHSDSCAQIARCIYLIVSDHIFCEKLSSILDHVRERFFFEKCSDRHAPGARLRRLRKYRPGRANRLPLVGYNPAVRPKRAGARRRRASKIRDDLTAAGLVRPMPGWRSNIDASHRRPLARRQTAFAPLRFEESVP